MTDSISTHPATSNVQSFQSRATNLAEKGLARLRWSSLGSFANTTVPLPHQELDERAALAALSFLKVGGVKCARAPATQPALGVCGCPVVFLPPLLTTVDVLHGPLQVCVDVVQQHGQDALQPVTSAVLGCTLAVYSRPQLLRKVCLSPYNVVDRGEYER